MRNRMMKVLGIVACGCSFQLAGCDSGRIAEIMAEGVKDTFVAVSAFAAEAVIDDALGLDE